MSTTRNLTTGRESDLFPGQFEHEEVLIFIRRHWISFVPWLVIVGLMLVIPLIVLSVIRASFEVDLFRGTPLIYVALCTGSYLLLTSAVFLTAWIEHYLDVTILTPERLINIFQVGLFNRKISELNLMRIQDVSAQIAGPVQALFRYGTVVVESAGEAPNFVMRFVPKPHVVANTILVLHDQLMSRSSGLTQGGEQPAQLRAYTVSAQAVRNDLASQMSGVNPPQDYRHDRMREDLMTPPPIAASTAVAVELASPPDRPVASSPNRLPPAGVLDGEELREGETVELP